MKKYQDLLDHYLKYKKKEVSCLLFALIWIFNAAPSNNREGKDFDFHEKKSLEYLEESWRNSSVALKRCKILKNKSIDNLNDGMERDAENDFSYEFLATSEGFLKEYSLEENAVNSETSQMLENHQDLSYEEKMQVIMEREHLTYEQLDEICSGICQEAYGYEDAYASASTLYNRVSSRDLISWYGVSLYDQFTGYNQFEVYGNGNYLLTLGRIDLPQYQAAIDMFYSGVTSHDNLSFCANWEDITGDYIMFDDLGNKYFGSLQENDRVDHLEVLNAHYGNILS